MTNLYEYITSIKEKLVKPKVYALVLTDGKKRFLWQVAAYSLEEAYGEAKKKLQSMQPADDVGKFKIDLFTHDEVDKLFLGFVSKEMKENKNPIEELMKVIIEKKDKKMFEENKSSFSEPQIKFIEDKLKK